MIYQRLRDSLFTGDILLFSGRGPISATIRWITKSRWSHVGMVLRIAEWDMVLCWESTSLSKVKDVETGKPRLGVQLVPLSARVKDYDGEVAVRQLIGDVTLDMEMALADFRHEVKKRPYETSMIELAKSAYDGRWGENEEDLSSLFCSELLAESYQRMGLLPEEPASNEYVPDEFAGPLELIGDFSLDDPIMLKED